MRFLVGKSSQTFEKFLRRRSSSVQLFTYKPSHTIRVCLRKLVLICWGRLPIASQLY